MDIYRIVDRDTDEEVSVYMRGARDEYNFGSVESARRSNCHGIYEDRTKYKIRKYKLVLVDDDCDPPTKKEIEEAKKEKERMAARKKLIRKYCDWIALERDGVPYDELDSMSQLSVRMQAEMTIFTQECMNAPVKED